jgi:hypothetical protein
LVREFVEEVGSERMSIGLQRSEDCGQSELHKGKMDRSYTGPMGVECFKVIAAIDMKACRIFYNEL